MLSELDRLFADDAPFKCSQGCGTFQRASCLERYGQLTCPRCKGRGTLRYIDLGRSALTQTDGEGKPK